MSVRRMGDIYVGEENGKLAERHRKAEPRLPLEHAHTHHCPLCNRDWYCWCWGGPQNVTLPDAKNRPCLGCFHEAGLPKVIREGNGRESYKRSRLFSDIEVSNGGWSSRWVTTRELRAALSRWIAQEYKASPPEVSEEAGSYQCGGCRWFLALDSDYGICANKDSRYDGRITFEHIGCEANPYYVKNHQEKP